MLFLATPHRGSPFANNLIGRTGAGIASVPDEVQAMARRIDDANADVLTPEAAARRRAEEGIRTTSPGSPLIVGLSQAAISSRVTALTIVGDRGKGGGEDATDGIVPYWSSHLEGAASERVVPSNHIVHDDRAAIEEVRRILLLHLEDPGSR